MTKIKSKTTQSHLCLLALTSLGALIASPAWAQDSSYTYGGISVGQSHGKVDETGMARHEFGATPTITNLSRDDKDNAYRVFLGYQFNRNVGLEASFFNLGRFNFHSDTTAPTGTLDGQMKIQGGGLDVVGALPLSDNWSLLGRVGGQFAKTRDVFTGGGGIVASDPAPSARQFNYKAGAGLQYRFAPNFLMRLEGEQYRTRDAIGGNARVQVFSLSLVVPFGAGATRMAAAPAYTPVAYTPPPAPVAPAPMAMAPAPAPVVVAAAPMTAPPTKRTVSFTAESLFGFDKAAIRPEGRAALDTFAREVAGSEFSVIVVNGYTDRVGSTAYNQALSLQRAEAVKAYLVSSGMDANKITTTGLGETNPVTQAGDCKSSLPKAELRACLQPDRRVDVDVNATR